MTSLPGPGRTATAAAVSVTTATTAATALCALLCSLTPAAGAAPATPSGPAAATCTVAIDPGHNGAVTNTFDPVTGVLMADYPNGAEDADALDVSRTLADRLGAVGIRAVLLKDATTDDVTYRQRVDRARDAGAVVGVSVHTTPGADGSAIFPQRTGGHRTGTGADGTGRTVTFDNPGLAAESQRFSAVVAASRSLAEGRQVPVKDNSFDARPGLWAGNLPVISLIADTPWVYSEFGSAAGGGALGISAAEKARYADGLAAGVIAGVATAPQCSPVAGSVGSVGSVGSTGSIS
jgi:N-acetylmuramoyl-L-alanine amidase